MKYSCLILPVVLLFFIKCQTTSQNPDEVISDYYEGGKFNGSILIAKDNRVIIDTAFGYRDFASKSALTKETPVYVASLSKPITAVAIFIMEKNSLLSFDDKVSKFIDDLPTYAQNITIQQLLNHTSGINDYENILTKKGLTNNDVIQWLHSRDGLAFVPGTKFQYSNTGYIILALVIEKVSKMTYSHFLRENIFEPLQMHHTMVYESNTIIPNKAIGHDRNKQVHDYSILTTGDGGIYSTPEDLYKLDLALRNNRLLPQKNVRLFYQTPILQDGTNSKYGSGWFIDKSDGVMTAHHTAD